MINKIVKYFQETKQELIKVAWPSKMELRDSTIVVVVLSIILSLFIGVVDYALTKASTLIFR
ncbi:MAG: preprotein translocase subunit SecE [candidate division Zixibacteria bacterium]|nr:preprotein translocase subunit SecE [candidate division Zixibacteria bacterium]